MCFNYSLNKDPDYIENRFHVRTGEDLEPFYHRSAVDAPFMPVISDEKKEELSMYKWGLIPHWVKDEDQADNIRKGTVNARSETIFEKPSFRNPIRKRRCLVIADGFFEWREVGGRNYPYYIKLKDYEAFAFAGIWDSGSYPNSPKTFSIITTEANPLLAKIHNKKKRMPVILEREDEVRWLKPGLDEDEIVELMGQYDQDKMEAYPVRRLITQRGVDDDVPEVIEPYEYSELNFEQETLF